MSFTFQSYQKNIELLYKCGYSIVDYHYNCINGDKIAILRHDLDFDLNKAYRFAQFEHSIGVKSTYFVFLGTDFYNLFSKKSREELNGIIRMGHEIGLHFDETAYDIHEDADAFTSALQKEASLLSQIIGQPVKAVSMHRPSSFTLNGNFSFDNIVNSYSQKYFKDYKYVSDSRMHWRENLEKIIESGEYNRLHILTHPFWYSETEETTREKLMSFINDAKNDRYLSMSGNFRNIEEFVSEEDVK